VQALFDQMQAESIALGDRFLDRYVALEQAFRDGTITMESLQQQTASSASSKARFARPT